MTYSNCLIPSDVTGTGVWRLLWPQMALAHNRNVETSILRKPPTDPNYYSGMNMIMFQRLVSDQQKMMLEKLYVPVSKRYGVWLITNLDDCLHPDEIPEYNQGRPHYLQPTAVKNIQYMLDNMNMIIVSTDEIKTYYHEKFNVPLNKLVKIPNYLPEWQFGSKYSSQRVMDNYAANKKKPRIGIISSTSHFSQNKDQYIKDDLDIVLKLIESTTDIYQWVVFGHLSYKLESLVKQGKIEFHHGTTIQQYSNALAALDLNMIVAPLIDNTFNRCKSNIKILEASALGIPFLVQDLPNYSRYTQHTFSDAEDLRIKLKHFFNLTKYDVRNICDANHQTLHLPHGEGNSWWLQPNIKIWEAVYKIRQNTIMLDTAEYANYMKNQGKR